MKDNDYQATGFFTGRASFYPACCEESYIEYGKEWYRPDEAVIYNPIFPAVPGNLCSGLFPLSTVQKIIRKPGRRNASVRRVPPVYGTVSQTLHTAHPAW